MFRIGQKVVCIHEDNRDVDNLGLDSIGPKEGDVITIKWIGNSIASRPCLAFIEYEGNVCWDSWQFRPLVEDGFAEELLANITEQVKKEELTLSE